MTITLHQAAAKAVEDLRHGHTPKGLPESSPGWNEAFVSAIRCWKDRFRDSPDLRSALEIVSDQLYGKDIHWALELIQNAEDAGAKKITFQFDRDEVRVANDGKPFTAEDMWGICSVGQSRKKNKIGFFGIGFKSVHEVTYTPEIKSGPYALRLEDKIYPSPLPLDDSKVQDGALFVLPVRGDRRFQVEGMIDHLSSPELLHLLLTLESLEILEVVDLIGGRSGRFYRERTARDPEGHWDEYRIGGTWPGFEEQTWRRYEVETAEVPPGLSRQGRDIVAGEGSQIILARPADGEVRVSQLHCFLPVDVPSELRWLVQADFDPTPGRERLRENAWNGWLFGEVGRAIAFAVSSEVRDGNTPWPLIPLQEEIRDNLQMIACSAAVERLRSLEFLRTARGWQRPSRAAWPAHPELRDIVRDTDLAAIGTGASYLRSWLMPAPSSPGYERSVDVLTELGAVPVACEHLIELLGKPDEEFYRGNRSGDWWLTALDVLSRHASAQQLESLDGVACIPVQGSRKRMRPSPDVAMEGYLIAFSRTNNLKDLRAFFGDSEVFLVDIRVAPRSPQTRRKNPHESDDIRDRVRDFLIKEPFHVARDAGPYHVVRDLVLPRMAAFAGLKRLDRERANTLWRMVEYARQKWPQYVTEHRNYRRKGATEEEIASELSGRFHVVARVVGEAGKVKRAEPISDAYLPTSLLGFESMDVALEGIPGVAVIDAVHEETLPSVRFGGRRRAEPPSVADFLRLLGGGVGPRVYRAQPRGEPYYITEAETPWVDWSVISDYERWKKRDRRLESDWVCPDLDRLKDRWKQLDEAERRRRGQALWRSIQEDWEILSGTVRARLAYLYYNWKATEFEAFSTWVGRLSLMTWVEAGDESLQLPTELVLDTPSNRLVLANEASGWAGWPDNVPEAVVALGVKPEPPPSAAMKTLRELHNDTLQASEEDSVKIARACYELLSRALGDADTEDERDQLARRFREELSLKRRDDGLVFAPPRHGQGGRSWWPYNRVLREERAVSVTGPNLGYLGARYRKANALWTALRVERDLTPSVIVKVIEDLALSEDGVMAPIRECYGRLVAALDKQLYSTNGQSSGTVPALTDKGWEPADTTFWTRRREVERAFGSQLSWWRPGAYDPSTLRRAATYLGVREIGGGDSGGGLLETWQGTAGELVEEPARSLWLQALHTWPGALRAAGYAEDPGSDEVLGAIVRLEPEQTLDIKGELTFTHPSGETVTAAAEPRVLVRLQDGVFLARDEDLLFSREAAEALAACLPVGSLQAEYVLAALLAEARDDPASLDEQSRRYEWAPAGRQFTEPEEDDEDDEDNTEVTVERGPRPRPPRRSPDPEPPPPPPAQKALADIRHYIPGEFERLEPDGNRRPTSSGPSRGRRPPRTGDGHTPGEGPIGRPGERYSNIDIENAAAGFVVEYEWQRGGFELRRQGPRVGADYVAVRDGKIDRYIEIKSSRGKKDAFDMTRDERLAGMDRDIGPKYWIYVVEHLGDGQDPTVTAVLNPVADERVSKEPKGSIVVKGWRASERQCSLAFAPAAETADDARTNSDGSSG
jgi:hypothetical protein